MKIKFAVRSAAAAALACVAVLGGVGTAAAAPSTTTHKPAYTNWRDTAAEAQLFEQIISSPDQDAAWNALTPAQQVALEKAMKANLGETIASTPPTPAVTGATGGIQPLNSHSVSSGGGNGCWWVYMIETWTDFGVPRGQSWEQLNWCGNGSRVTSYHLASDGGRGLNGETYYGVTGTPSLNVGWEVRQVVETHFDLGISWFGLNAYPCTQIRGGASGLYSIGPNQDQVGGNCSLN